jgi:hypothetical protein
MVLLADPEAEQPLPLVCQAAVPQAATPEAEQLAHLLEHSMAVEAVAKAQLVLMVEHLPIQVKVAMAPLAISMAYLQCMLPEAVAALNYWLLQLVQQAAQPMWVA